MPTTPPMYDQLLHGTVRNRALAWFADHSYRRAAMRGAVFALGISVVQYLVRELDELMPGIGAEPAISMRWFLVDGAVMVLLGAMVMCLATASARGLVRAYVRTRTGRGLS
ncbi:MAG TPA: hypothetical protein VF488_00225 [Gemmatimonadaceae bacterium]